MGALVAVPLVVLVLTPLVAALTWASARRALQERRQPSSTPDGSGVWATCFLLLALASGPVVVLTAIYVGARLDRAWVNELTGTWARLVLLVLAMIAVSLAVGAALIPPGRWLTGLGVVVLGPAVLTVGWFALIVNGGVVQQTASPDGRRTVLVSQDTAFLDSGWVVSVRSGSAWMGREYFVSCVYGETASGAPSVGWVDDDTLTVDGEKMPLDEAGRPAYTRACQPNGPRGLIQTARSTR